MLKITLENTFSYQVQDKLFTLYAIVWIKGRIDSQALFETSWTNKLKNKDDNYLAEIIL